MYFGSEIILGFAVLAQVSTRCLVDQALFIKTPCKANIEKQEEFVEHYKELKENLKEQDQIYFMDGVHPQHNCKLWLE